MGVWPGLAADLSQFQPCWRGQSGTTFQTWGFSATPTNIDQFPTYFGPQIDLPDTGWINPYGTPQAVISDNPAGAAIGWFATDSSISTTLSGIWDLGYGDGAVTLTIPNAIAAPSLTRDIWIQITEATTTDISTNSAVSVAGGTMVGSVQRVTIETHPNYTWVVSQTQWRVPANSAPNIITITGGCDSCNSGAGGENSFIDSVVVDTRVADYSTISPGGSLNIATQTECTGITLDPGSLYTWEMKDAAGAAGVGFDQVSVPGTSNITVLATSGSKCSINLISLNGASPGQAAGFNNNTAASWPIASAVGGSLLSFDASKFAISATTAQFQNNLGGGLFSVAQSGDGKSLNVVFTPNHSPTASDVLYTNAPGLQLKIRIADLLAGSTSDPDGNPRALSAVDAVSAQGGAITSDATTIYYEPINGNADSFNYTVRDVLSAYRAGDPVRTATAKITVSVVNSGGSIQMVNTSGGAVTIHCAGIPGYPYDIERSAAVSFTSPTILQTTNAPANGMFSYTDSTPPMPSAFYRLKQH